jgi:hypothetical protein
LLRGKLWKPVFALCHVTIRFERGIGAEFIACSQFPDESV